MAEIDIERARFNMIEQQIRPWHVLDDRILDVLRATPREAFVPERYRALAFSDIQIPLPQGQVMMEPKVEARLLVATNPQPNEQVLEIGAGSGYMAACLSKLAAQVTSVELYPELAQMAERNLKAQGIGNVSVVTGDAAKGWEDGRRYDVIVVSGSLPELHQGFHQSLAIGGRLVAIVGGGPIMEATLITRTSETEWTQEGLFETSLPALVNAASSKHRFAL